MSDEMVFNAQQLAPAWLAVQQFSAKDDAPVLNRTVCIEEYVSGVRLVATDRYVVLRAWVPVIDSLAAVPDLDESPIATHVAIDNNKRAGGLLAHLLSLADAEDAPIVRVRLSFVDLVPDENAPMFSGMETRGVRIEHPGIERVTLSILDGEFPGWRKLVGGFKEVRTDAIALNPEILGRLAKAAKFFPECPIVWRWGGPDKPATVELFGSHIAVAGLVMPVRLANEQEAAA